MRRRFSDVPRAHEKSERDPEPAQEKFHGSREEFRERIFRGTRERAEIAQRAVERERRDRDETAHRIAELEHRFASPDQALFARDLVAALRAAGVRPRDWRFFGALDGAAAGDAESITASRNRVHELDLYLVRERATPAVRELFERWKLVEAFE